MTYQRKCSNWLETFLEWTAPRSIAPLSVLTLCGLFAMSSALRRHVKVPKRYLGGYECFPHLYINFVAPPGVITKSTSIGFAESLIRHLPQITRTPSVFTTPVIGTYLGRAPDSCVCMIVSEFGTAVEKSGPGLFTVLTDLFDGKRTYDEETISRGEVKIENPLANLIAATTPDWLSDNVPQSVVNGGYGSRTLWIYESQPRQKQLLYHKVNHGIDFDAIEERLVADLDYIAENIHGEFEISETDGADEYLEAWYQGLEGASTGHKRVLGWEQRKPLYVMKMAMLLTLSTSDKLVLTKPILESAVALINSLEGNMFKAFNLLGKNKYNTEHRNILAYIQQEKRVLLSKVHEEFVNAAEPKVLESILTQMHKMGKIGLVEREGVAWVVAL